MHSCVLLQIHWIFFPNPFYATNTALARDPITTKWPCMVKTQFKLSSFLLSLICIEVNQHCPECKFFVTGIKKDIPVLKRGVFSLGLSPQFSSTFRSENLNCPQSCNCEFLSVQSLLAATQTFAFTSHRVPIYTEMRICALTTWENNIFYFLTQYQYPKKLLLH